MDITNAEIFENDGLWHWRVTTLFGDARGGKMAFSPIGFPTKEGAARNLRLIAASPTDGQGRSVLPREEIDRLIKIAANACADCAGLEIAPIRWHEHDSNGCNWELTFANGDDVRGCFDCIVSTVNALRATCNIPDEA
ncbi:hypothetical protein [Burkholderia territorii]|uniref:hypothetical protein n=1 Tax=Burkholderia territorii TaxID=1503055 RepID=UPI000754FC8F|nr:hypothetical protein [Burkholderia territorii]KWA08736.1 hypothetical protein WT37_24650 [Burkholderia territorii]KWO62453.1 hypothetical protein WT98_29690 [Burkholderia territorii]